MEYIILTHDYIQKCGKGGEYTNNKLKYILH